tara:strand:+ start:172 stop:381 length:210 start_codon:yes stop_codon:yes gene_type:complete
MNDLERMKAEFAAKGGKVTVLPATKYEAIVADNERLIGWGYTISLEDQKVAASRKDQIIFETGGKRDDE